MSVHANHWNLYRPNIIKVVIAQVICRSLKLFLIHTSSVIHTLEQDRLSSANSYLVRYHVKIVDLIPLNLNNGSVDDCPIAWIQEFMVLLYK
jgi:hypothetical protein